MRTWRIVPTSEVMEVWGAILPWVTKACQKGLDKYSAADFLGMILAEDAQLWVDDKMEGAAISNVTQFPNKKSANVLIGMGERPDDLASFIEGFDAWAKDIGCDLVRSEMRPGFSPQFFKQGWNMTHVTMEKVNAG